LEDEVWLDPARVQTEELKQVADAQSGKRRKGGRLVDYQSG
jgi:hypothetical protein